MRAEASALTRTWGPGVWLLAFVVRVLPTILGGATSAILEYDDGVHYSAGLATVSGHVPYRSFTFVQPPGALYLFAPEALIGKLTSEGFGLLLARLVVAAAAATTAWLIYRIVSRNSRSAGVIAGAIYAVWEPAVLAGRTAMLEPLLTLGLVISIDFAGRRESPRLLLSGVAFAVACAFKLWAAPLLPLLLVIVARRHGWQGTRKWLLGAVGVGIALVAPFLVLAPDAMWRRVVLDQAARPPGSRDVFARLQFLSGWSFNTKIAQDVTLHGSAIFGVIFVLSGLVVGLRNRESREWGIALAANLVIILAAPSFYYHYAEIVVAPLAISLGNGLASVSHVTRRKQFHIGFAALLGIALALSVTAIGATGLPSRVADALRAGKCPWTMSASVTVAAGVQHRVCGGRIDYYGDYLHAVRASGRSAQPVSVETYQALIRRDFDQADVVALQPGDRATWDTATAWAFEARFVQRFTAGDFTVFAAR